MNKNEYMAAASKIAKQREQTISRISRLQKKLDSLNGDAKALDRVWEMFGNEPIDPIELDMEMKPTPLPSTPKTFGEAQREAADRGQLVRAIREIVEGLSAEVDITSELIRSRLEVAKPDLLKLTHPSSIPGTLGQLRRNKELVLTHAGAGRRAAVYRRVLEPVTEAELVTNRHRLRSIDSALSLESDQPSGRVSGD
jgi:hypothetical protein